MHYAAADVALVTKMSEAVLGPGENPRLHSPTAARWRCYICKLDVNNSVRCPNGCDRP